MKDLLPKHAVLLLFSCLISTMLFAQDAMQRTRQRLLSDAAVKDFRFNEELKTISSISFSDATAMKASDAPQLIKKYFNLSLPGEQVDLTNATQLSSGLTVKRYRLSYKAVVVEHSAYIVLLHGDKILSVQAESYTIDPAFSVTPILNENAAMTKALAFVNASRYAWDDLEREKANATGNPDLWQRLDKAAKEYFPKGELVIAKNKYGDGQATLAWKFDVYATEPLSRNYIYVDAKNGKIILRDAIIKHTGEKKNTPLVNTPPVLNLSSVNQNDLFSFLPKSSASYSATVSELGSGTTRYAGTRNFYTTRVSVPLTGANDPNNTSVPLQYSGVDPRIPVAGPIDVFILKDDTRGNGIETYDMNAAGGLPVSVPALTTQALAFVDKDNNWKNETAPGTNEDHVRGSSSDGTNGGDESLNDDYALDAHWGAEMVYDYWKTIHNRLSFDNLNSAIKSYVHYGPAYDNAFWNGTVMTYGDGSGTTAAGFRPLTSLDVCAHEIGHGVCSFTSNLVYESESGAMNEGLSDIWAACVEHFAKTTVDPSLPYQYFQIGEQISADNIGLRRMDNPKAYSNPDTYGGQYWANPVCTPTLVNDECGVHNNSGLLNKWFYLLVQGPGTTTGAPGFTDDGLADNGAVVNGGNNYGALGPSGTNEFIGLGFTKAEAIVYLMEQLLTPNATYAQARVAAINAVRALYGECSQEEKSVTDAWYAINVGPSYAGCALPVLSASTLLTDVKETASGSCDRYNEYNINTNLTVAQGSAVTINFTVGSTTMSADEYALSASSVTYNTGETGLRTVKLRIYDDAMIEADESITVNLTSASPALNTSFIFTVRNDDVDPIIGGTQTLLSENFESTADGSLPAGWAEVDRTAAPTIRWAVRSNGLVPLTWTGKRAIIEQTILPGQATYDQLTESQVILKTPLINAAGLNRVRVKFVYQSGGEPACDPACDYAQLMYSLDGINFSTIQGGASTSLYIQPLDGHYDYTLPLQFNGKQFYLGIAWINDANAGTSTSVTIDSFVVSASGRAVETQLASTVSEKINGETGKPTYFYSTTDGDLIARLSNSTTHNYGCMSATIEKAGNSAFELYVNGTEHNRVGDKLIRMTPTTNNLAGAYSITLYYTEAEIAAIEAFTGLNRTQLFIYKTSANPYTGASAANTERTLATHTAIPGTGGSFTASFSTGFSAFALGAPVVIPLPLNCLDFKAVKKENYVQLVWTVTNEVNNRRFEIEKSADGLQFYTIASIDASTTANGVYSYNDQNITGTRAFYRLKQIDISGTYHYVCNTVSVSLDKNIDFSMGDVYPNPSAGEAFINIYTARARKINLEYVNPLGQVLSRRSVDLNPGSATINLKQGSLPGNYIIRFSDEEGATLGYRKFNRY